MKQVYGSGLDRAGIARLAPMVLSAYHTGTREPVELVENNAAHLGGDAAIVMRKLFEGVDRVPVALAGGVFTHCPAYGELVLSMLRRCRVSEETPEPLGEVRVVEEPAGGAVELAVRLMTTSGLVRPLRG